MGKGDRYTKGPEFFEKFGGKLITATALAALGLCKALGDPKALQDAWLQMKYTVGTSPQFLHELAPAIGKGDVSIIEALKLAPLFLVCILPMMAASYLINLARKKRNS